MLYFILIVIALLIALRVIIRKPAITAKRTAKVNTLTRHENAIGRAVDRTGW